MSMKLNINLEEDEELRKYLKELIRNQVKSVVREEITNVIREIAKERIGVSNENLVDKLYKEAVKIEVEKVLGLPGNKNYPTNPDFVKDYAKKLVDEIIESKFNLKLPK